MKRSMSPPDLEQGLQVLGDDEIRPTGMTKSVNLAAWARLLFRFTAFLCEVLAVSDCKIRWFQDFWYFCTAKPRIGMLLAP
jgi:hypothetical protein